MRISPNILRSKGNQIVKFGRLIEHNMRNILRKKSYIECDEKTSPRPLPEN